MKSDNKRLLIRQMDEKFSKVSTLENLQFSKEGWVRNLRKLLNVSLEQLGKKVGVSPQAIKGIETRERTGAVTIKSLNQLAEAMDMKL
ncbi:MAG: helix-turn-helix domain-containing protein, partial [Candidatus Kuenenia stuttgartiensis]|nr:helix-turn-helix domain-containing protein [Candidatus Kuenenia stuttgartiensis]